MWHTSWLGSCWQNTPEGFIDKGSSESGASLCLVGLALARERCLWGCVRRRRCLNKSSTVPLQHHSSESHAVKAEAPSKYFSCKKKAYKSHLLREQIYIYQSQQTRTRSLPALTDLKGHSLQSGHFAFRKGCQPHSQSISFLLSMVPTSYYWSRPVVLNLFGNGDQFCGRQFFHGRQWGQFQDDSSPLHLLCTLCLLVLHQLHPRSSSIRFQRLGTPGLYHEGWRGMRAQLCPPVCDPMDCGLPGSSVHGISQARILEWVVISSSKDLPNPGTEPASPVFAGGFFTTMPPETSISSTSDDHALDPRGWRPLV